MATTLNSLNAKVRTLNARSVPGKALVNISVEIKDLTALNQLVGRLRSIRGVQSVVRSGS